MEIHKLHPLQTLPMALAGLDWLINYSASTAAASSSSCSSSSSTLASWYCWYSETRSGKEQEKAFALRLSDA
jgi:hypothetical protein